MKIRVYTLQEREVYEIIQLADEGSFVDITENTHSQKTLGINGKPRLPRQLQEEDDYLQQEDLDEIFQASILDTAACYGSSQRSRSLLRIYVRHISWQGSDVFWVFDFGEVGSKGASSAPWTATSIQQIVLKCDQKIKIEIGSINPKVLSFVTGGEYAYRYDFGGRLDASNGKEWLRKAVRQAVRLACDLKEAFSRLDNTLSGAEALQSSWPHAFRATALSALIGNIMAEGAVERPR